MTSVALVAPARFYREGLAIALQSTGSFDVSASAALADVEFDAGEPLPHILLLDITDRPDSADKIGQVHATRPDLRVIALGVAEDEHEILACTEAGAAGYATPEDSVAELARTIDSVARGEMRCSPRIAAALSRRVAELAAERPPTSAIPQLSPRETEIAVLLKQGLSNQEISRELCIALATVKNHVHSILEKLDLPGRADAAAWVRRQGLDRAAIIRGVDGDGGIRSNSLGS